MPVESIPVLKEPVKGRKGISKLLLILIMLFIILLAVLFFNSSISKISSINIQGQIYTGVEDIKGAAGIKLGDAYFGTRTATIIGRVKELKSIKDVVVEKHFPGKVTIRVLDYEAVAFELSDKGDLTAILANGFTIAALGSKTVTDKPVLTGWHPGDPVWAELCKTLSGLESKSVANLSEIMPYPSNAYPDRIKIYTRTGFEVVTAVSLLADKLPALNAVIEEQEPGKITMLLADTYVSFNPINDNADLESGSR